MPDPRCERISFLTCPRLGKIILIGRTDVAGSFLPNLLNTPPSFCGRGHGEGDLYFLSLLKTLAYGDGLRECLLPYLLLGSIRAVGVLDSE
ncbi:hypothetical protein Tco_0142817 [Tanacetum coccineum]